MHFVQLGQNRIKDLEDENDNIDTTICQGDSAGLSEADVQLYVEALGIKYHEPGICQSPEFGPNWVYTLCLILSRVGI